MEQGVSREDAELQQTLSILERVNSLVNELPDVGY
jgi:hypothetical protein